MAIIIAVRTAQVEDAPSIAACLESAFEAFRSEYTPTAFQDTVLTPEGVLKRMLQMTVHVAVTLDGEIVGTLAAGMDGSEGHLRGMAVRPSWQGNAIAEELLSAAEDRLSAAGCVRVSLDTTLPLQRAIRFYQRNGFVASGKVRDFFGMPVYEYVKSLIP